MRRRLEGRTKPSTKATARGGSSEDSVSMIRLCDEHDLEAIHSIVNEAARAYEEVIPADCWHEPYMPWKELLREIDAGVVFWGYEEEGALSGVMGIQDVEDVALIRHAYVRRAAQRRGIGSAPPPAPRPPTAPPGPRRKR